MKNIFTIFFLLINSCVFAQPSLEHVFQVGVSNINLSSAGYKYISTIYYPQQIILYNLDYSIFKNIIVPSTTYPLILFVSDKLFDLDDDIEYMADWNDSIKIFNEDGSILFERDSADLYGSFGRDGVTTDIISTDSGTKMIVHRYDGTSEIYGLPGSLPCTECNGGIYQNGFSPAPLISQSTSLLNAFPNPASGYVKICYQLQQGEMNGEIILFSQSGIELKHYNVDGKFPYLVIPIQQLPNGAYYYQMKTESGISEGKKIIILNY